MTQLQAVHNQNALTIEQKELIRDTVAKGCTDDELKLFLYQCSRRGLDPLLKQAHAVKRWNKKLNRDEMTMQTAIDGFRLIAERTGQYEGQDGPFWCGPDGKWVDVWLKPEPPFAAKVGVWKKNFRSPLYAVVKFDSFKQTTKEGDLTQFWSKMPDHMIAKCAESQALRKAFPEELSGIYTAEEMAQADQDQENKKDIAKDAEARLSAPKPPAPIVDAEQIGSAIQSDNSTLPRNSDYVVTVGSAKIRNKKLYEIDLNDLRESSKWFRDNNKGPEFVQKATEYLADIERTGDRPF